MENEATQAAPPVLRIEDNGGTIIAPSWPAVARLQAKIVAAMSEIEAVEHDKTNAHFNYRYTSYDEAAAVIRAAMCKAGLAMTINHGALEPASGKDGSITTLHIYASFGDPELGAQKTVHWLGQAQDSGDKGIAKALTMGVKYGLMRMFLTSSEDDGAPQSGARSQSDARSQPGRPAASAARPASAAATVNKATGEISGPATPTTGQPAQRGQTSTDPTPHEITDAEETEAAPEQKVVHPKPADGANRGQKLMWVHEAFKLLKWDSTHQRNYIKKHFSVNSPSDVQNGHLDELIDMLFIECEALPVPLPEDPGDIPF